MTVERGDFISLSYTGRLDNGDVFDTTDENVAKENGLLAEGVSYAPITIVVGENMVVKGLDEDLIGKKPGYEGQIKIAPQDAFGQRIPELIEVVPTRRFEKRPAPGMRVTLDNRTGTVESVIGGACAWISIHRTQAGPSPMTIRLGGHCRYCRKNQGLVQVLLE